MHCMHIERLGRNTGRFMLKMKSMTIIRITVYVFDGSAGEHLSYRVTLDLCVRPYSADRPNDSI